VISSSRASAASAAPSTVLDVSGGSSTPGSPAYHVLTLLWVRVTAKNLLVVVSALLYMLASLMCSKPQKQATATSVIHAWVSRGKQGSAIQLM